MIGNVLRPLIPKPILRWLRRRRHMGTAYECTVCLSSISHFLPLPPPFGNNLTIGGKKHSYRDYETLNVGNYLCPVCGATDRDRLYALYFRTAYSKTTDPGSRFVHFAPDHPLLRKLILGAGFSEYRTSDLYMKSVDDKVDIQNLRCYSNDSVHGFLCSHVLEHVPNDKLALKELHRVLHPNGWGIVMVPILLTLDSTFECSKSATALERVTQVGQADHVRVYAKTSYMATLLAAGFKTRCVSVTHFGHDVAIRHGLSATSTIYVVTKDPLAQQ